MTELCEGCEDHLYAALRSDDLAEKNYHIRQVFQATTTDVPDDLDIELRSLDSD